MTPALRAAAAGLGAAGLLVVAALASRGGLGGTQGGGGRPSAALLDYGFTIVLVLYVLAIPVALWAWFVRGRESRAAGAAGRRGPGLLVQLAVFALVVGLGATVIGRHRSHGTLQKLRLPPTLTTRQDERRKPAAAMREPRFRWPVVLVVATVGAAGAGFVLLRRRRGERAPVAAGLVAELGAAVDDAIDDVRAEADPRRAVIRAYARMEAILAAHGLPRRPSETPYELLARALAAVAASGASVARLTDLYEEARFSTHAIPPELREEALVALIVIRDDLRAAAA